MTPDILSPPEDVKASDFPKGSRVRIRRSELKQWTGMQSRDVSGWNERVGTICGSGRSKQCYVRWDGNKSTQAMWPGWLELVELPKAIGLTAEILELREMIDDLSADVVRLWKEIDALKTAKAVQP